MLFDIVGHPHTCQSLRLCQIEKTLHFTIKAMSYLLEHDISIGIFTGMLTDSCNTGKNLIHICHIEITAKCQILGTPVISSQERMNIRDTRFSGSRIA